MVELLVSLYTDATVVTALNALKASTVDFIRFQLNHLLERKDATAFLRRVIIDKETNKKKTDNKKDQKVITPDIAAKIAHVVTQVNAGLKNLDADELAQVSSYLDDIDPAPEQHRAPVQSTSAGGAKASNAPSSDAVSTRPSTRPSPVTFSAAEARLVTC